MARDKSAGRITREWAARPKPANTVGEAGMEPWTAGASAPHLSPLRARPRPIVESPTTLSKPGASYSDRQGQVLTAAPSGAA